VGGEEQSEPAALTIAFWGKIPLGKEGRKSSREVPKKKKDSEKNTIMWLCSTKLINFAKVSVTVVPLMGGHTSTHREAS